MASKNNLDKNDGRDVKIKEEHQNSSRCANNNYDIQLCKVNAVKSFQNKTLPTSDGFDELGK